MFWFLGAKTHNSCGLTLPTAFVRHKPGGLPVDFAMLEHCMDLAKNKAKAVVICFCLGILLDGLERWKQDPGQVYKDKGEIYGEVSR